MKNTLGMRSSSMINRLVCLLCASTTFVVWFATAQEQDRDLDTRVKNPAYTQVHPKIMLDRGHFNLRTRVGQSIDKSFGDLFTIDGYSIVRNEGRFEAETLRDVRVLVTAAAGGGNTYEMAANPAFTPHEVDIVSSWVERGGSLFLLFDHFPIAAAMETLANRFGAQIELGLASDEAHSVSPPECPICFSGWIEYTRDNGLLRQHPITEGRNESERLNRIVTFGGSSVSAPGNNGEFLALSPSATNVQYQSDAPPNQKVRRAQAAAFRFGKGRVVMLADTNVAAAQVVRVTPSSKPLRSGMGYEGADNRQLVFNIMHWLSGLFG